MQAIEGTSYLCHCSCLWSAKYSVFAKNPVLLALCFAGAFPIQQAAAQISRSNVMCGIPTAPVLGPSSASSDEEIEITFGRMALSGMNSAEFSDNVEIRQGDRRIATERARYDRGEEAFEFEGRVTYSDIVCL